MMRRLKDTLANLAVVVLTLEKSVEAGQRATSQFNQSLVKMTKGLYWFTIAIFFLGAVQVVLLIYQIFFRQL